MIAKYNIMRFCSALAAMAVLCACKSGGLGYTGRKVSEDRRIAISGGGPHPGSFNAEDITLDYEYTQAASSFNIAGTVRFTEKKVIWSFRLDIHFADSTGAIIDSRNLVTGGNKQMIESLSFDEKLNFPSNAAAMTFSYSGTSSGTGNSGSPNSFWLSP